LVSIAIGNILKIPSEFIYFEIASSAQ